MKVRMEILFGLLVACVVHGAPFPEALNDAAIEVGRMDSILDDALIIGNGDINALVWNEGGATTLMLTKNDVWDARLLTHNDPPLPTLKRIKELGARGGAVGITRHGFIFPDGYSFSGKDSYHAKPYPCPILCGKLILGDPAPTWHRIRAQGTRNSLKHQDGAAVVSIEGKPEASNGYAYGPLDLSTDLYSRLVTKLSGTENAQFYIDVMGAGNEILFKTGWQETPTKETAFEYDLPKDRTVDRIILYSWTEDGKRAENQFEYVRLEGSAGTKEIEFSDPSAGSGRLDISKAVATIDNRTSTTLHALADRNVFLIRTGQSVELVPSNSLDVPAAVEGARDDARYLHKTIPGDLDWKGMEFAVAVAEKGDLKAVAIVTSLESGDVVAAAVHAVKKTLAEDASKLIAKHEETWKIFWSRSGLKIDDELLQRTWYRGLYFLRCVSKPGVQCPGLFAGLINNTPAWHGDYHTNYNIQQVFWAAYAANQLDLLEPYDRLIREYIPRGRWLAKKVYGMGGAYYPHVMYAYEPTNPETCKSRNGRQYIHHVWGLTLGVSGFTIQPVWWHYKYEPDTRFLEDTAYPVVREVAEFYVDFIEQCEGGKTVLLGPSVSPEHHGWTPGLALNYNCAFDIAMIRFALKAAIECAETLGRDETLVKRCRTALSRLPDYTVHGKKNPIVVDVKGAGPMTYNISVPATPVFPGDAVSFRSPEKEQELFERTIQGLRWNGNNATVMLAVSRARLSMDGTLAWLKKEVQARTRPNGTMTLNRMHPPHGLNNFGHYTEQFGTGVAISEMLIQSVDDIIRLFPAWPKDKAATFELLRTQGGFLVSAEQNAKGKIGPIRIQSTVGGTLRVVSPWKVIKANGNPQKPDAKGIIRIKTRPGEMVVLTPGHA